MKTVSVWHSQEYPARYLYALKDLTEDQREAVSTLLEDMRTSAVSLYDSPDTDIDLVNRMRGARAVAGEFLGILQKLDEVIAAAGLPPRDGD